MKAKKKRTAKKPLAPISTPDTRGPMTHGMTMTCSGNDGIQRRVTVHRYAAGFTHIFIDTWWNGPHQEPLRSPLYLTGPAVEMLQAGLQEFFGRLPDWRVPPKPEGGQ